MTNDVDRKILLTDQLTFLLIVRPSRANMTVFFNNGYVVGYILYTVCIDISGDKISYVEHLGT